MGWIAFILVWVWCGYLNYGWIFAYFQREYPTLADAERKDDMKMALLASLAGPVSIIVTIAGGYTKHGRKYK